MFVLGGFEIKDKRRADTAEGPEDDTPASRGNLRQGSPRPQIKGSTFIKKYL
jgi:hypothetical protein